jgi:copper transport protein
VTLLDDTEILGEENVSYDAVVDGQVVTLRPQQALTEGSWAVSWKVISADGHPIGGVLRFTIGENTPNNAAITTGAEDQRNEPLIQDRALEALTWILVTGAAALLFTRRRPMAAWVAGAALTAAALRAVDFFERYPTNFLEIGFALLLGARSPRTGGAAQLGLLLMALSATQSGHPLRLEPQLLYSAAHSLHLYAGLLWAAAVTATLILPDEAGVYSRIATRAVLLLLPSATVSAVGLLSGGDYDAWETLLTVKLLLVIGALAIGAVSHLLLRRLATGHAGTHTGLRRRSVTELALLTGVAVLSAWLTTESPSRFENTTSMESSAETTDPVGGGAEDTKPSVVEKTATLTFEDGTTASLHAIWRAAETGGTLTMHIDHGGAAPEQAEYEVVNAEGVTAANGEFTIGGVMNAETELPNAGTWTLRVTRTLGFATSVGEVTLELP